MTACSGCQSNTTQTTVEKTIVIANQNHWKKSATDLIWQFQKMNADIYCAEECQNVDLEELKEAGLNVYSHANNHKAACCIVSKLPFAGQTPNGYGTYFDLGDGVKILVMVCHGNHVPYGPYQFAGIKYGHQYEIYDTPENVWKANKESRQDMVDLILEDLKSATTDKIVLCGDFNEPSWLDWTEATTKAGTTPCKLEWPTTKSLSDGGLDGDAYRTIHPDPVSDPGYTWSSKPAERDTKDRIDFILYKKGHKIDVTSCEVVGESTETSDDVIDPWYFDHRAVRATFRFRR